MTDLTSLAAIHATALVAAKTAEAEFRLKYGEPAYCGFAWVHVSEKGSTRLGKALIALGFRKAYGGGLNLWNPGGSGSQSMDLKEEGANAYAAVFQQAGIKAYASSRAD